MEVHYIGAKWCIACRTVKPLVLDVTNKAKLPFVEHDYDKLDESRQKDILKLPTVQVKLNGNEVAIFTTGTAADSLKLYLQSKKLLPEEEF